MNNLRVCNGLDGSIPTRASNKSLMFSNVFLAAPTFADTTCVAANFSSIIGTTCDIGPLQFQFTVSLGRAMFRIS